tara:strand:+ start:587 stop:862 length:276 start_codon:yes stop_codon:yes gene_type:complete
MMNTQRMVVLTLATALLGLTPPIALGAEDSGQQRRHQGPPPEAIEACDGKQLGDEVGFTGRRGETLEARCQERDGKLVAMPTSKPERGNRH